MTYFIADGAETIKGCVKTLIHGIKRIFIKLVLVQINLSSRFYKHILQEERKQF